MIEWMQKHKKWLVITIWISTISFIAAGMVGWGSYNFSLNENVVAKVGQLDITQRQLENRYRQLYMQYNADGKMDAQKAQELDLENQALKSLIEQALLQNFALDLGLRVSHQEIIDEISKLDYFQKEGQFDASLYKELLKQNNIKPADFEEDVQNDLLIKKVASIIPFGESTPLEQNTFSFPLQIQDTIQIKILTQKNLRPNITEEELKSFWQAHKNQFEYPSSTKIEYILVNTDSQKPSAQDLQKLYKDNQSKYTDDQGNLQTFAQVQQTLRKEQQENMAEEKALREYVALKKSTEKYGQERILLEEDKDFGVEVLEAIDQGQAGETLKPIKTNTGFLVVKILEKTPRSTKSFEDAKQEVLTEVQAQKTQQMLEQQAQKLVEEGFEGEKLQAINQESKIKGLNQEENQLFLNHLFTSTKKRDYVSLQSKMIVFEVLSQTLSKSSPLGQKSKQIVNFYKGQVISQEFYKYLQNQYKITTFKKEG
ncbi:peptidylprolyl isomerase [Helicobacter kayseriensis]|uniref:peptidylprolyl isomerase n=1 Tax=Helicobacter kayseriensis TaxID=2905877 RepID=UPI001E52C0C6|nr:peptidylprolyl isomerase [Helicobacter kayseriensis]MCE3047762.1 SurA N-terminal domain-containing protein [Helicobacter kayseriensis]